MSIHAIIARVKSTVQKPRYISFVQTAKDKNTV